MLENCLQARHEALQHHRRLARAGNASHHRHPTFRECHLQRLDRMNIPSFHEYPAFLEHVIDLPAEDDFGFARQVAADYRIRVILYLRNGSLGDDLPALGTSLRAKLYEPI